MKKIAIGILLIGILCAGAIFFMNSSRDTSKTVAIVNGEKIKTTEFEETKKRIIDQNGIDSSTWDEEAKKQFEVSMLDALISQKLLEQAIAKDNIKVEDSELEARFSDIKTRIGTEEEYKSFLTAENFTEQEFKDKIREALEQEKYFEQKIDFSTIAVTDEEVKTAFEQISQGQEIGTLEENAENLKKYVFDQKKQELIVNFIKTLEESAKIEKLI